MTTGSADYGRHAACPDCGQRLAVLGGLGVCRNAQCPGHTTPPPPEPEPPSTTYAALYSTRDCERTAARAIRAELTRRHRNGEWR